MNRDEVIREDKRGAAIHEAGHAVICSLLGGDCKAHIFENEDLTDLSLHMAWVGRAMPLPPNNHLARHPLFSLAGYAAEMYFMHDLDDELIMADEIQAFENALSKTDREGCPSDSWQLEGVLRAVLDAFKANREFVLAVADVLEDLGFISDGMLREIRDEHEVTMIVDQWTDSSLDSPESPEID